MNTLTNLPASRLLKVRPSRKRAAALVYRAALPLVGLLLTVGNSLAIRGSGTPIALFVDNSGGRRGVADVVIETKTSLNLGSGTITLRVTPTGANKGVSAAVAGIEGAEIVSKKSDSVGNVKLSTKGTQQTIRLEFKSKSATINRTPGPLAIVRLRLADNLRKGAKYRLQVVASSTSLRDRRGRVVDVKLHDGELTVRGSHSPYRAAFTNDVAAPGTVASFDLETLEAVNLSAGQLAVRYDTTIAAGRPTVRLSKNHGSAQVALTYPQPGLMLVRLSSANADWNSVSGALLRILLPLATGARQGSIAALRVDSSMTYMSDEAGNDVTMRFSGGQLEVGDDTDTDNDGVEDADDPDDDNDGILDADDNDDNNDGIDDADDNDSDNDGIDDVNDSDDDNDGIPDDEDTDDDGDGIPDDEEDGGDGGNGGDDGDDEDDEDDGGN